MDSFEFNKIAGAVLGTALGVMALSIISEMIYAPAEPKTPGYVVAISKTGEGATTSVATGRVTPIAARLQTASADNGEAVAKKCLACHTLLKDQSAKVGPNLWGVVAGPAAHMATFKYSDAITQAHDKGLTWTYDNLDQFLTAPKMFLAGTAMGFAGLPLPQDRADVIAYLRTLSDSPPPLPPPPATPAAPPSAPVEAATATALPVGHADAGAAIFLRCSACHRIGPDATNSVGPVLNGIVGRKAGTYSGYAYSDANKNSGIVWSEQALAQYLPAPTTSVPGTKMPFALTDPQEVADVIAYLKQYDAQGNKVAGSP